MYPKIPEIDHKEYPKKIKNCSMNQLEFIIRDSQEAILANPKNPKNGYYHDEIHYCEMEISKRMKKEKIICNLIEN